MNKFLLFLHPKDPSKDEVRFRVNEEGLRYLEAGGQKLNRTRDYLLVATKEQFFNFFSRDRKSYKKLEFLDNNNSSALADQKRLRSIPNLACIEYDIDSMNCRLYF